MSSGEETKRKGRRALPIIIIVLATIIAIVSVFALWAKRQVLETDTWRTTSEELIQDADIQSSLNTFIVAAIFDNVDVQAELADKLPPQLAPLAAPISGALRSAADNVVAKALSEPKVQQLFVDASAAAQSKLIALIDDKGEFVSTTGGVVTLDLTSVLASVTAELGLPDVASKLPPEASSIEVMRSDQLGAAQTGLNLLKKVGYVLTALTLLLYAAAIALAGARRRQTLRAVGFSFILVGVVVLFARGAAGSLVVDSLSGAASSDAAVSSVFNIGSSLILETGQSIVVYGIVIVLAAWLAGPTRWATSIRHWLTPYLRQPALRLRRARGAAPVAVLVGSRDRHAPARPLAAVDRLRGPRHRDAAPPGDPRVSRPRHARLAGRCRAGDRRADARGARARVATAGAPAAAAGGDPRVGEIERLAGLRDSGALTDEEFAAEKARILASG